MGSQQFCLKWNNHQSNMLVVFEQLLSNEALVDVTLACEGHSLKAHKMVLSACSPFFQALFVENPCKHPIVILKDMRYMDLKAIVEFMYKGEVNVSQDQLSALLKTAETLKVKGLAEVTGDNRHGLVSVDGADARTISTARPESPPMSKRKRGRPRRRSPSDSNKSDSEDQGAPPATRIKAPESPEIIEDGSMSSDRVTAAAVAAESPAARTSSAAVLTAVSSSASTVALSNKVVGGLPASALTANSMSSQHTQDSVGDDTGVDGDDADFEVEPSNLMEQSMTTENVPVFADVASSSQAAALASESQQSHHTGSTSDNSALVPVPASLPSDISISSQLDIKPSPSSLIPPFDEQAISPVVPPQPAGSADGSSSAMMMAFTDMSGVPAIAGPSNYHPDKQQSTPSHAKKPSRYSLHSYFPTLPCQEVRNGPVEESREFILHNIAAGMSCPQSQAIKVEESSQSIIQDMVAGTPDLQFQPNGTRPPSELLSSLHTLQGSPAQVPQAISPPTAQAACNASVSSVSTVQDPQIPYVRAVQDIPLPTVQAVQNIPVLPGRLQRIRPVPLPGLPLETMAEFNQCELALVNESTQAAMLELMTSLGGTTVPNTTRIIMERTLRKSIQCRLSLMGRRQNKLPFKGTRFCTIMCEAIHVRTKESIVEIERYLGRYLAGAPDREGGRRQR